MRPHTLLRRLPVWLVTLALPLGWVGACSQKTPIGPERPSSGGSSGSSSLSTCPSDKGPPMVLLPALDGSSYCMDLRETTRAEYDAFVKAKAGDTSGQPAACSWNTSFVPVLQSADADTDPGTPFFCMEADWNNMRPDQAVGCVDFCDALAYCEWAGKRLCGRVGKGAERIDPFVGTIQQWETFVGTVATSTQSEFINACTQGGKTTYPYGDSYEPGRCIDQTWVQAHGATALDVTDTASRDCHGTVPPFDGVYDLSGSVKEWQDICYKQDNAGWGCIMSGPDWQEQQTCTYHVGGAAIEQVAVGVGFRCCADPVAPK